MGNEKKQSRGKGVTTPKKKKNEGNKKITGQVATQLQTKNARHDGAKLNTKSQQKRAPKGQRRQGTWPRGPRRLEVTLGKTRSVHAPDQTPDPPK